MILSYLSVDIINGFLIQSLKLNFPLSMIYKGFLLLLLSIYISASESKLKIPYILLVLLLFVRPAYSLLEGNLETLTHDLPLMIKYLMLIASGLFGVIYAKSNLVKFEGNLIILLRISYYLVIINVLIGYLGLGYPTYPSTGLGFKGYFQAGNELSALFIIVSTFHLYFILLESTLKNKILLYFLHSGIIYLVGISIATKSTTVAGVLIPILLPLFSEKKKLLTPTRIKTIYLIAMISISMSIGSMILIKLMESGAAKRAIYFYERDGLLSLIFSGREQLLTIYISALESSGNLFSYFFGFGSSLLSNAVGRNYIEIDPFDAAMYFGLPFSFLLVTLSLLVTFIPLKLLVTHKYAGTLFVSNILLLFFSFLAGHVWTSGLLGITWGVSLSLFFIKR